MTGLWWSWQGFLLLGSELEQDPEAESVEKSGIWLNPLGFLMLGSESEQNPDKLWLKLRDPEAEKGIFDTKEAEKSGFWWNPLGFLMLGSELEQNPDGEIGFSGIEWENWRDPDGDSVDLWENEGDSEENR